jgi:hypothetical protein
MSIRPSAVALPITREYWPPTLNVVSGVLGSVLPSMLMGPETLPASKRAWV